MAQRTPARPYWQVLQQQDGAWYIHLKGTNHRTVVWGGGWNTKQSAEEAVRWVRTWAASADGP